MDISLLVVTEFLRAAIRMATPLIIATTGGIYSERSGSFPVAMEGWMLIGAFGAVAGSRYTGSILVATLLAITLSVLLSIIFAYLTVHRRADNMVIGIGVNIFALALTNMLAPTVMAGEMNRANLYPVISPDGLQNIPIIGPVLFAQPIIVWIALILPLISAFVLFRTKFGLNIRSVGEYPRAAAAAGISVIKYRYYGILIAGLFAGLAGAALALAELGLFVPNMSAGKGFVVLASHVVGKWNPIPVTLICLMFGTVDAFQLRAQLSLTAIPYQFFVILPYVVTVLALAGLVGRTQPPKALGVAYDPEAEV